MCGICSILYHRCNALKETPEQILQNSRLANRGPDGSRHAQVQISDELQVLFCGHVLHLRGDQMACQPARDDRGNLLLWNGEVFSGIQVPDDQSDTTVLLNMLGGCAADAEVTSMMSQIQGPWSFIYWQASSNTLWFGRDVFGRRSLLWHLPEHESDMFALCSVQIKPWVFKEVPSVGIFKMTLSVGDAKHNVTLFPWQHAVWPGSLDRVQDDGNFTDKLYSENAQFVDFDLSQYLEVPSQMPRLNKAFPPANHSVPQILEDQTYLEYLQNLLKTNMYLKTLSKQLTSVLLQAVKTRVENQHSRITIPQKYGVSVDQKEMHKIQDKTSELSIDSMVDSCATGSGASCDSHVTSSARVAILFSGGIDSTVIAALADKCVPQGEPIDLLNVAFELKPKQTGKKTRPCKEPAEGRWDVPDRLTGYTALSELNHDRPWNFIEVNVTMEELQQARASHIHELVYPLQTVLDDSIGCAVWFAARGMGVLGNGPNKGARINSSSRVILCGMGADEQLVGYSRHRVRFKEEGWPGLIEEIELEVTRISARNLGRDDRIITDHGKESRFPFLDERVVQFLSSLPVHEKADLSLPRGLGEKLLLRLSAVDLGLYQTATLPKRAIQFGSRIAKLENSKEKASDICSRLTDAKEIKID